MALSVNAHSSAAQQAAAETFMDFVARPAENLFYTQVLRNLTQHEFLEREIPSVMRPVAPVIANHADAIDPLQTWWNANVGLALTQAAIGLVTGQTTVDQVLQAMDAAWKQRPA
jgi:raffinose/stachyose/melibiose transport system substrate-binding protein